MRWRAHRSANRLRPQSFRWLCVVPCHRNCTTDRNIVHVFIRLGYRHIHYTVIHSELSTRDKSCRPNEVRSTWFSRVDTWSYIIIQGGLHYLTHINLHVTFDYVEIYIIMIMLTSTWPVTWSQANSGRLWIMRTSFQPVRRGNFRIRYGNTWWLTIQPIFYNTT